MPDGFNGTTTKHVKRIKRRLMDLKLATWNVRTLLQPGKMIEVANELLKYQLDIVALQEVRWSGKGQIDKKDFTINYSGPDERTGLNGVGIFVSKKIKKHILGYEPISERLCKLRLKGKFQNI